MAKIKYTNSDEEVELSDGACLKDAVDEKGWGVPFGCEDGVCGTCIVNVTAGAENLSEIEEKEKMTLAAMGLDDGEHRLACQCKVKGDIEFGTH